MGWLLHMCENHENVALWPKNRVPKFIMPQNFVHIYITTIVVWFIYISYSACRLGISEETGGNWKSAIYGKTLGNAVKVHIEEFVELIMRSRMICRLV